MKICGNSFLIRQIKSQVEKVASTPLAVLILGESGTGKELLAQSIHQKSGRTGKFVAINCGALPKELIESELFGHEKGAFTGAQYASLGCFRESDKGTLFLDEIAELPIELQPKLLRALEQRSVRPVGGHREIPLDIRIIAATHQNLEQAMHKGFFRQDLYYRIAGVEIVLPPLRLRPSDIPELVRHFLTELGVSASNLSSADLQKLMLHPWRGNIRELKHAIQRAVYLHGARLTAEDILSRPAYSTPLMASDVGVIGRSFIDIEKDIYIKVLEANRYNRQAAARMLGVPRSTLYEKIRRFGISSKSGDGG